MIRRWRDRACKTLKSRNGKRLVRQRREFLPAAIEIERSPPSPLGRTLLWLIISLFATAVTWACLGSINIVAVASGEVIPGGRTRTIQPLERGVITAILVHEHQHVDRSQPLILLDSTATSANRRETERQLRGAAAEWLREAALDRVIADTSGAIDAGRGITEVAQQLPIALDTYERERQQRLLQSRLDEYTSRRYTLLEQRRAIAARRAAASARVTRYRKTLPLIAEHERSIELLYRRNLAARSDYLAARRARIEAQQELAAELQHVQELTGDIGANGQQSRALKFELLRRNGERLEQAEQAVATLQQQLRKATSDEQRQTLRAPVSGTVQELAVNTVGGVVTPAQALLKIVPDDAPLTIEAKVLNRDVGFVHAGQIAAVKVAAFDYTRYGTIQGRITALSHDAVRDQQRGLVYPCRVTLATQHISVDGKRVRLTPGMAVTVEVRTGRRRVIEYFLSPLLRYAHESIRER